MQREERISKDKLDDIVAAVFDGSPTVYEAYSDNDSELVVFQNREELDQYLSNKMVKAKNFVNLAIHYPETKGYVYKRKIELNPDKCKGATFRYSQEGWGLIQFQLTVVDDYTIKSRFAVNTETRAQNWESTIPDMASPEEWEWKQVEKNARRLIRVLRKCA